MWNKFALASVVFFTLSAAQAAEKGMIRIVTEPGEAQITVNGDPKGTSPAGVGDSLALKLDEGNYTIEATKNGLSKKKEIFVASDSLQTITINLPKTISDRYIDNGDGTVTDIETKLMWKKCSEGQSGDSCSGEATKYKWDDAMSKFGSGVSFAGYSNWRIPGTKELESLFYCSTDKLNKRGYNHSCPDEHQKPTIDQMAFPNTSQGYWGAFQFLDEIEMKPDYVCTILFNEAFVFCGSPSGAEAVRLVRSGQ